MKYFHFSKSPLFFIGLLGVVGVFLVMAHYTQSPYSGDCRLYDVNVTLETDKEAGLELYYDVGREFHEVDHQETKLEQAGEKLYLQFTIPVWTMIEKIRIDPVGAGITMKIYDVTVSSQDGTFTHKVALDSFTPGQQILNGHWDGTFYTFETPADAFDPILLVFKIDDPHLEKKKESLMVYFLWGVAGLGLALFGNWMFRFFILGL